MNELTLKSKFLATFRDGLIFITKRVRKPDELPTALIIVAHPTGTDKVTGEHVPAGSVWLQSDVYDQTTVARKFASVQDAHETLEEWGRGKSPWKEA